MPADLESPEKVGRTAGERAVARLNPRKVETTKVPIVYDKRVASSLVGQQYEEAEGYNNNKATYCSTGSLEKAIEALDKAVGTGQA